MKTLQSYRRGASAFTLLELLISIGVGVAMFAAIMSAAVANMKTLAIAEDYSAESQSQLRAMDYIIRDLRRATTVSIAGGGSSVTLTMPDCYSSYDSQGNPTSAMVTPTITNGATPYSAQPLTVTYSVSGTQLIRTQTVQSTGAVSTLVIGPNVNNFQMAFVQQSTTVTFQITFVPKFQLASALLTAGTTLSGTVSVRGVRFQ